MNRPPNAPAARAAERGSAYLFALLALLVLTVIGLSLVVVTQTEVQIGGAQKSANRVLYGADSGLRIQMAMKMVALEKDTVTLETEAAVTPGSGALVGTALLERVDMSPFAKIYAGPCSLCSINMGSDRKFAINHVVNAQARRLRNVTDPCADPPQASRLVSGMFFIQPFGDASQADAGSESGGAGSDDDSTTISGGGSSCVNGLSIDSIVY
ncbi:MAG TPA: hypothetical protein VI942_00375 [Thermoanaerobaculia bacterium]|nr:hypothetical protein [Thermoanaerobaculia bacterium]